MIEAMARAHCDYFGGAGHYDSGLAADNKPTMNAAMLDAVAALIDNLQDGAVVASCEALRHAQSEQGHEIPPLADYSDSDQIIIKGCMSAAIIAALQHVKEADHG